jgi:hypothetical protein
MAEGLRDGALRDRQYSLYRTPQTLKGLRPFDHFGAGSSVRSYLLHAGIIDQSEDN